ncbi:MAG: hypothetical protein ACYS6W_05200 [Planctomycetota bacterium]
MAIACRFPWWPMAPFFGAGVPVVMLVLLTIAGVVFSLVMLIDCLKRPASKFLNPLTKKGEYDKLIWAAAIVASFWFYFLGAIVYFFIVMKATPESGEK